MVWRCKDTACTQKKITTNSLKIGIASGSPNNPPHKHTVRNTQANKTLKEPLIALNGHWQLSSCHWPAHHAGLLWSNFFGQPGSVSKFPPFLCVKLWVGWVGRGYTELSSYFPALWINRVTLVTKIKLWYSLGYEITFESPKMPLWYAFLRLEAWLNLCSIPFLPQQLLWLVDYLS